MSMVEHYPNLGKEFICFYKSSSDLFIQFFVNLKQKICFLNIDKI